MDGDVWDMIAPVAGAALGTALLPGVGTAMGLELGAGAGAAIGAGVGSGLNTGIKTGDPLAGLASGALSGVGSYAGGQLGNAVGDAMGGVLNQSPAEFLGMNPENSISDFFNQATIGSLAGGAIGSHVAQNAGSDMLGISFEPKAPTTPGWSPSRAGNSALPNSLANLGGLTPQQQATGIATQGVYGSGQGGDENKYFLNLINNRLVDDAGNVGSMDTISPIESSYLAKLGLGGYTDPSALLRGIGSYQA